MPEKNNDWFSPEEIEEMRKEEASRESTPSSIAKYLDKYLEIDINSNEVEVPPIDLDLVVEDIFMQNGDLSLYQLCSELSIVDVFKDIDTNIMSIAIRHSASYGDTIMHGTIKDIEKNSVGTFLVNNGVISCSSDYASVSIYLKKEILRFIDENGLKYTHNNLGWVSDSDNKVFLWSESINREPKSQLINNEACFIGQHGDKYSYDKMLREEVFTNKNLHLIFTLGFVSAMVPLMTKKIDSPNILINLAGSSSRGKSTSLCLLASVWGKGEISNSERSIIKTFSSTKNGLESSIGKNCGIPIMFDDYSTAPRSLDFKGLIYDLVQGESKQRSTSSGKNLKTTNWSSLIVVNGESTIFDLAGTNGGLQTRVIELSDPELTNSETNAVNIKATVSQHYGFYGPLFIEELLKYSQDELNSIYDENIRCINEAFNTTSKLSARVQLKLALIRMTAQLVNKAFNFGLDVEYITNQLIKSEAQRMQNYSIDEKAKDEIIELINKKLHSFVLPGDKTTPASLCGRIYIDGDKCCVAILPKVFNTVLDKYNDKNVILKKWKDEGFLLVNEKENKFQRTIRINTTVRCYILAFEKDFFDII